jgi:hypothetical protein
MSGFTIVPALDRCDTPRARLALDRQGGRNGRDVAHRVPVEVELEIETGEIIDVHIIDERLEGPLGVFNYELVRVGGRLKQRALELVEQAEWPGWTFGY